MFSTSTGANVEIRIQLVEGEVTTVDSFDMFFAGAGLRFVEVSAVVERATELRAEYNFKTTDTIDYVTAVGTDATVFLTGGRALAIFSQESAEVL